MAPFAKTATSRPRMREPPLFEVVATRSGARAMRDRTTGEVMHPLAGPVAEARDLYLRPSRLGERLGEASAVPLVILDVGLGAGSNAVAAWTLSEGRTTGARRLEIVSFDRTDAALALALEHTESFGFEAPVIAACTRLLQTGRVQGERTVWRTSLGELPATLLAEAPRSADVVYWDPFSPRANRELWTAEAFSALRRLCRDGATVHTYSGATATRTALLLAGFAVGLGDLLAPGRQATVAATRPDDLELPLDRRWLARLSRSSAPFPPDAPADAFERVAAMEQFRRV
jgi:queuine tRNA-ribosyltransferase